MCIRDSTYSVRTVKEGFVKCLSRNDLKEERAWDTFMGRDWEHRSLHTEVRQGSAETVVRTPTPLDRQKMTRYLRDGSRGLSSDWNNLFRRHDVTLGEGTIFYFC